MTFVGEYLCETVVNRPDFLLTQTFQCFHLEPWLILVSKLTKIYKKSFAKRVQIGHL